MRKISAAALCLASLFTQSSYGQTPPRRPAAPPTMPPTTPATTRHTVTVAAPVVVLAPPSRPSHPTVALAARPQPAPVVAPAARTPSAPVEPAAPTREDARNVRRRDPCEEALRAVEFEDHPRAEDAWRRCRATLAPPATTPNAEALTRLELVASALQSLRRTDGAFCVAPSAPFDLEPWLTGVTDARQCFVALDRFLSSETELRRWILTEPYAAGRLALRSGVEIAPGRTTWPSGARVQPESVAIARLAGRRFMRVCRCLPGPQPETEAAVRAMHLPVAVERVLLAGIAERRTPSR